MSHLEVRLRRFSGGLRQGRKCGCAGSREIFKLFETEYGLMEWRLDLIHWIANAAGGFGDAAERKPVIVIQDGG
jgi:hypothetical protein